MAQNDAAADDAQDATDYDPTTVSEGEFSRAVEQVREEFEEIGEFGENSTLAGPVAYAVHDIAEDRARDLGTDGVSASSMVGFNGDLVQVETEGGRFPTWVADLLSNARRAASREVEFEANVREGSFVFEFPRDDR